MLVELQLVVGGAVLIVVGGVDDDAGCIAIDIALNRKGSKSGPKRKTIKAVTIVKQDRDFASANLVCALFSIVTFG